MDIELVDAKLFHITNLTVPEIRHVVLYEDRVFLHKNGSNRNCPMYIEADYYSVCYPHDLQHPRSVPYRGGTYKAPFGKYPNVIEKTVSASEALVQAVTAAQAKKDAPC
jgi:hypothetical protein